MNNLLASKPLTWADIVAAKKALEAMPPTVYGIACSPSVISRLRRCAKSMDLLPGIAGACFGIPFLQDIRMEGKESEVYYDEKLWMERCKEQRAFDATRGEPA